MSFHNRRYHYRRQDESPDGHGVNSKKMITHRKFPLSVINHDKFSGSWQPLPLWEKRFCTKVGAMSWNRFVEAKRNLYKTDKVFDWDDTAALMAFNEAKQRFWAEFHGVSYNKGLPSDDLYIDKDIDWNPKIDPQLFSEIKSISDDENDQDQVVVKELDWFSIPLDQIKPTGWTDVFDYSPRLPQVIGYNN